MLINNNNLAEKLAGQFNQVRVTYSHFIVTPFSSMLKTTFVTLLENAVTKQWH